MSANFYHICPLPFLHVGFLMWVWKVFQTTNVCALPRYALITNFTLKSTAIRFLLTDFTSISTINMCAWAWTPI